MLVVASVGSAGAYTQQEADACTPDAFRLCAPFIPDAGKVEACLRGNRRQLTAQCAALFGHAPRASRARQAGSAPARP
jgi:hypothetical protein